MSAHRRDALDARIRADAYQLGRQHEREATDAARERELQAEFRRGQREGATSDTVALLIGIAVGVLAHALRVGVWW